MRSTRKTVTFHRPFRISGVDGEQPAGDYDVTTDEEQVPDISFVAWYRVGTSMRFPALGIQSGQEQWASINPNDLSEALEADKKSVC